jgi:signal transduction histidine kinase/CheY-like chemotaxis protein
MIYVQTRNDLAHTLLQTTKLASTTLEFDHILSLTHTDTDYDSPAYLISATHFVRSLQALDHRYRNLYLLGLDGDSNVVFWVDVERNIEKEYPQRHIIEVQDTIGKLYDCATPAVVNAFTHEAAFVEGPFQDEYGTWVSGIVSIVDPATGKVIAVIGLDFDASDWKKAVFNRTFFPILMLIMLFFVIILGIQLAKSRDIVIKRSLRINKQRDVLSKFTLSDNIADLNYEKTLDHLVKILSDTLSVDNSSIWLLSAEDNSYHCRSYISHDLTRESHNRRVDINEYREFFTYMQTLNFSVQDDIEKSPVVKSFYEKRMTGKAPKSVMHANIWNNKQIIGIVVIENFLEVREWQADEISFVETISAYISQIIAKEEKEKAEQDLLEEKQRFVNTLESIADGFLYFNKSLELKFINHNAMDVICIPKIDDNIENIWELLPPGISKCLKTMIKQAMDNNKLISRTEFDAVLNKWIEYRVYPTHEDVSIFFSDVTRKRHSEKALLENHRLSAISDIANAFSHDFNNYLQVILANIEVLIQKLTNISDVKDYMHTIQITTNDAATRVQMLQRMSGTKQKSTDYDRVVVNTMVADAILQAIPTWKTTPEQNGVFIKIVESYKQVPDILGCESELRTVVYNMLKNSVEAMPTGGEIRIETDSDEKNIILRIHDNGKGMTEEVAKKAFDPFFSTKGFDAGKGLGLVGVHNIITEHSGTITITDTQPEVGTTFEITLPIYDFTAEKPEGSDKVKPIILWVDDDDLIREIGYDMLSSMGYDITVAESGAEALDILANSHFDILLSDIGMPGMSGWQLMDKVHELYPGKYKRALISGWGDQITDEQKREHHVDIVIGKPIKMNQMKKLLEDLWG